MKKFNYSLQKVLEIKELIRKNLKIELSNLNKQYEDIELEIQSFDIKYKTTNKEIIEKSAQSISIGEISYYKMYLSSILKKIETKEAEKILLYKKIEEKRNEIINSNMEVSSFEKLRDKEYELYLENKNKKEEIFIDEFISNSKMIKQYMF